MITMNAYKTKKRHVMTGTRCKTWFRAWLLLVTAAGLLLGGCTKEERADAELTAAMQEFVERWFPDERVRETAREGTGLRVRMCRGTQLLFDAGGQWGRIENPFRALPRGIVAGPVEEWLDEHRPEARVLLLEHADGYAVGLDTRELMRFDDDFHVTIQPWKDVDNHVEFNCSPCRGNN